MRAVFLDYDTVSRDDLDRTALERLLPGIVFHGSTSAAQAAERIAEADIVITNKQVMDGPLLRNAPRLKLIALAATGTDNIDLETARERGIGVCNVRGYCTRSVVQQVWALVLGLTQHLGDYARLVGDGSWVRNEEATVLAHPIRELEGRVFGAVGWGELGRAAAAVAPHFGMQVVIANRIGAAPQTGRLPLHELLAVSDIVSLHCPLTPQTRSLLGAAQLALMKPDALLINTARGGLVDSHALAAALKAGRLGGAGIDVLPQEPPCDGDPLLEPGIPNLLVTPHVAWAAREARQRCLDDIAASVQDFMSGGRRSRVV